MTQQAIQRLQIFTITILLTISDRLTPPTERDNDNDRGDVPGWVMITVMTAIVVIALLAVFRQKVVDAVGKAFDSVGNG